MLYFILKAGNSSDNPYKNNKKMDKKVKTLSDQMEEYSLRKEKIEQLKKELLVKDRWNVFYSEELGQYYVEDFWGNEYPIDVSLRDLLPNSYFYSPHCDEAIIGYDPITGGIIYDLWKLGKKEMVAAEIIHADFSDTAYGISRILQYNEEFGFSGKVPPKHIMQRNFIFYQNDLQECINYEGMHYNLHKVDINESEGRRLKIMYEIEVYRQKLENKFLPEADIKTYQSILDDLEKQLSILE